MSRLNLANWMESTEVEGPGKRFALWVQGCTINCPGCCNQHYLDFEPKHIVETSQVLEWIAESMQTNNIEGITLLGGEPTLQARGLSEIAVGSQKLGLSVMVFSGFKIEQLKRSPMPGVQQLLDATDILVDGPYVANLLEKERNWAGSSNQTFHFLTERYKPGIEFDSEYSRGIEMRVDASGGVHVNGWPTIFLTAMS